MNDRVNRSDLKPLVSFAVFSYNQEKYIQHAICSALAQTYRPLEIIISDDCSTDGTWNIIQEKILKYGKARNIVVNRNKKNLGINRHVNKIMSISTGELIVIAAGDDISKPERTDFIVDRWRKGFYGIFSNAIVIDEKNRFKRIFMREGYEYLDSWQKMVKKGNHGAWGCTFAWDKKIFQIFGELPTNVLGEDAAIPFRCALTGGLTYIDKPLVQYRDHEKNISFWSKMQSTQEKEELILIERQHLEFWVQIYRNWICDLQTAEKAGIISEEEYKNNAAHLIEYIALCHNQEKLLCYGKYIAVIMLVFFLIKGIPRIDSKAWLRQGISIFLRFHYPYVYRLLTVSIKRGLRIFTRITFQSPKV